MGAKMVEAMIPKQLCKPEFRFLRIRVNGKEPTANSQGWQKNNFEFNDTALLNHLSNGGNYGIIGGYGNLVIIDADSKEISEIANQLPETFTVKSGSPEEYKKHFFYLTDKPVKPIRLSNKGVGDLGDVRSVGQYVVGANCLHPSGNIYKIINDMNIQSITEEKIREAFKDYIDGTEATEFKEYPIATELRKSSYIKQCRVPDYLLNHKIKGDSSKNWKLFPYVIDVLHNRQATQQAYVNLAKSQGHQVGAVKGWATMAHTGKLAKSSCKKMRDYLERFHPELQKEICGDCPLYKKIKAEREIYNNKNYSELQKNVLTALLLKDFREASELLAMEIRKQHHIYTTRDDASPEMWFYKEGIYIPQGKTMVREFCREVLGKAYTQYIANEVITKISDDTRINQQDLFGEGNKEEIIVENGILNIRTKELSDFTPEKIFFNKIPVVYDPYAECPSINKFFKDILLYEEDAEVMFELLGFSLLKEYQIEKSFMLLGNGRNGKGKTLALFKHFLGADNCCSIPLSQLNPQSSAVNELFGRLVNLAGDLSNTDLKDTGLFKQVTGRDLISAKRKFLRDLHFVNYAKMIFACNELPKVYDLSEGFWSRWILLKFPYRFVPRSVYENANEKDRKLLKVENTTIIEQITTPSELSGLLNKALDGLDNILGQGKFSYTKGSKEVKDMWIRKSDSFTAFCFDRIAESLDGRISKKMIRRLYHKYCKEHKVKSNTSDIAIKIILQNMFGVHDVQIDSDRYWEGITLK